MIASPAIRKISNSSNKLNGVSLYSLNTRWNLFYLTYDYSLFYDASRLSVSTILGLIPCGRIVSFVKVTT